MTKKSLGQHWLHDDRALDAIVEAGLVHEHDTVLEIGPGLGTLTQKLLDKGARVIAVEKDEALAADLPKKIDNLRLEIARQDILRFDLTRLPPNYKVVANIPYYLTSKLLRVLSESSNPPKIVTLLVQKEVAERICAKPGEMSLLSVSVQMYYETRLDRVVEAQLFAPPPKVDSQIVQLVRRQMPMFGEQNSKKLFRVVKAGFSSRRKTLENSLSGGLASEKSGIREVLIQANIDPTSRPQDLSPKQWIDLTEKLARILSDNT
jgi:16S rRNA (adenine1518-N6/adenine1519-N6)-dimethyltransferase